ncbi:glycosyltransferase [Pseudomonas aeruginosa]|uniref:glycosyltransferase n=1 Tax=Pseudomonas aeruginosa TaxID=287 RepID=UPI0023E20B2D|nr:glycosyltransferase [Pseudomonas aeruginosa]
MVSLSSCIPIKRIDKIISTVRLLALEHRSIKIKWTHLGGGALKLDLESLARTELGELENVSFHFMGEVENKEAKAFFLNNAVDFFINASESEGVPVSIMEAMSAGVPAIAPCVGGIRSLIDNSCGRLLSENPTPEEYCSSISKLYLGGDRKTMRETARKKIEKDFSSEQNYRSFIKEVEYLVEEK